MNRILLCLLLVSTLLAAPTRKLVRKKTAPARKTPAKTNSTWRSPTYADSTIGDNIDGEDLEVRRAAVAALGRFNGTVVVVDPLNGRVLSIVNQKLALQSGFIPCSTIKLVTAFAALSEGIVEADTPFHLTRRLTIDLKEALAHSNNAYFADLGRKLGFERVRYYAQMFGIGEKAGLEIEGEHPGVLPDSPPANGGVGMMTSFGEGISLTPLELAAMLSAIANGGSIYYLQAPRNQDEIDHFVPRVKRRLEISPFIPNVKIAMKAVTDYGTGRRAAYSPEEPILGKTGTCTDYRQMSHMGWFGSFNDVGTRKLVVVVMLTGGKSVNGPVASGVAGGVYKQLSEQKYFAHSGGIDPAFSLISTQACCSGQ